MDSTTQENTSACCTFQLDVSSSGADKLKSAVKAKLAEFMGSYTDDVLAEYVVVLVGHGKRQTQAIADLEAFLGEQSEAFVTWLWDHLSANEAIYLGQSCLPLAMAKSPVKRKSSKGPEHSPINTNAQPVSQQGGLEGGMTSGMKEFNQLDEISPKAVKNSTRKLIARGKKEPVVQAMLSGRAKSASHGFQHGGDHQLHVEEQDYHEQTRASDVPRLRPPEPCSRKGRDPLEEKLQQKGEASTPRVRAPRRLLESAVRDAVGPAGMAMSSGVASRRTERMESRLLESAVRDAVGPVAGSINNGSVLRRMDRIDRTESRLLDSAVRDAVGSTGVLITSGGSSWRSESRLLESAVRDAVGHTGLLNSIGNLSKRTESGVKRLRSVVSADVDNPDLAAEANGRHHQVKSRLDLSKQGFKVPPAMAVALKAAAAAAEDTKVRGRVFGSVWDRLGNRTTERLGLKENEAQVVDRVDLDNDEEEGRWEDLKIGGGEEAQTSKRQKSRKVSDRLGKGVREDRDEIAIAPDQVTGSIRFRQGKSSAETKWHTSTGGNIKDSPEVNEVGENIRDAGDHEDGEFFRYSPITDPDEHIVGNSQDSASLQHMHTPSEREKVTQSLQQSVFSGLSGTVNPSNKPQNGHINSNLHNQQSQDADNAVKSACDLSSQPLKSGALLEKSSGPSPTLVDTNDVSEMKKRMRQVQLEMTKLRAKQAEVSKEVQKGSSVPGLAVLKARSQEDIDAHSICVTNIHFAATKEVIAAHFSNCGDIVRVTLLTDIATGKPRGSAFVEFSSKDGVDKALNLNDSSLLSRLLKVARKDAVESIGTPVIGHPSQGSFVAGRSPTLGKFLRGTPLNLRRPSSIVRPFPGTAHLQWKRDTSSPSAANGSPSFGHTNSLSVTPSGRVTTLWSPQSSLVGDRYGIGPIRLTRSMSYVRPTPYPPRETPPAVQEQKVAN